MKELLPGEIIKNFQLKNVNFLTSLNANLYEFESTVNRLRVFYLPTDSKECAFNICVKTPVENDKGIPHILEHMVLAGSRKYPVKDPFFTVLQSSPNTYMNAGTYSEKTMYLASSQIKKDFDNLFDIYLDAVYFPTLHPYTFMREGYRLDLKRDDNGTILSNNNLSHSGVVYNEMQGARNDPNVLGYYNARKSIFKNHTYSYDSGGDPEHIINLTHQEITDYHKRYYHPRNSCVTFVGDLDIEYYLDKLDAELNANFPTAPRLADMKDQPMIDNLEPETVEFQIPTNNPNSDILIWSFLGPVISTFDQQLDWYLLEQLLFDNDFSPIKHATDNAPFAKTSWPYSGINIGSQAYAMIGVIGAKEEDAAQLYQLIADTIEKLAVEGIKPEQLEYLIKRLNLSSRSYQTPIQLSTNINSSWRVNIPPYQQFQIDEAIRRLRRRMRDQNYIGNLLRQMFIANKHKTYVYLKPAAGFQERKQTEISAHLEKLKSRLTEKQLEILKNEVTLFDNSNTVPDKPTDLKKLPVITPKDIDTKWQPLEPQISTSFPGGKYLKYDLNTRGLIHLDIIVDISDIPDKLLTVLPLYLELIGRIGTEKHASAEMVDLMNQQLGTPISADYKAIGAVDGNSSKLLLCYTGLSLEEDQNHLAELMLEYIKDINFEDSRMIKLTLDEFTDIAEQEVIYEGHESAMSAARRSMSTASYWEHHLEGIGFVQAVNMLQGMTLTDVVLMLEKLKSYLKGKDLSVVVTSNVDTKLLTAFETELVQEKISNISLQSNLTSKQQLEVWQANTDVSYSSVVFAGKVLKDKDLGKYKVFAAILKDHYLHPLIREQGGAYGSYASADEVTNTFTVTTYRDPNPQRSIDLMKNIWDNFSKHTKLSQKMLDDAITKLIGKIDAPLSPHKRALRDVFQMLSSIEDKHVEQLRSEILKTRVANLTKTMQQHSWDVLSISTIASPAVSKQEYFKNWDKQKL